MKNKFTLLTAILLISFMGVNAQFTSGKYLLGGDINFSTTNFKNSDAKNQAANVSVKLGKLIKENTAVGINLSYGNTKVDDQYENNVELNQYGAGIFYRKYKSLSKDFHLFGEGGLNYNYSETKNNINNSYGNKIISNVGSIDFTPGLSYSLTKKLQVELLMPSIIGIGYTSEKIKINSSQLPNQPDIARNSFSIFSNLNSNFLSSFGIGFKFIL